MTKILRIGFSNIGFQLGSGIHSSWDEVKYWLERFPESKIIWKSTEFVCKECGESIEYASIPAPVTVRIFRCKNGHKYCYENTD